jgi:putative hydrolase of the HAD superfamily
MTIRAVIFDVYGTLLEVGPPPASADEQWRCLWQELRGSAPPLSRMEFAVRSSQVIAQQHADARRRGIAWPEVQWPGVVGEVLPEVRALGPDARREFIFRQIQLGRTLRLMRGAAEALRALLTRDLLLGIASNSQAYTLRELNAALREERLSLAMFDAGLRFWSFEHGFSKPDPHVFQILTARLQAHGMAPGQILMVGNRLDNDIEPARAHGWQAWQLCPASPAGGFAALLATLA